MFLPETLCAYNIIISLIKSFYIRVLLINVSFFIKAVMPTEIKSRNGKAITIIISKIIYYNVNVQNLKFSSRIQMGVEF